MNLFRAGFKLTSLYLRRGDSVNATVDGDGWFYV